MTRRAWLGLAGRRGVELREEHCEPQRHRDTEEGKREQRDSELENRNSKEREKGETEKRGKGEESGTPHPTRSSKGRGETKERPAWQRISGLYPELEGKMTRQERREGLRKLFKEYERLAREALAEHASDPEKEERTFLWEPVAMICGELGIARRKLSALTKELTGMAAHEVVDKIRAEKIEEQMEAELAEFFQGRLKAGHGFRGESYYAGWDWECILWDKLKDSRKKPYFDLANWAVRMGFPNYARFRRGVMLAHGGLTPHQLEARVLERFAEYYELAEDVGRRHEGLDERRIMARIQEAGKAYGDRWAKALRERPEWVAEMKGKLGMARELEELSVAANKPPLTEEEAAVKARDAQVRKEMAERERPRKE